METNNYAESVFLLCGPDPLKDSLIKQLKQHKVKSSQIHDEDFIIR